MQAVHTFSEYRLQHLFQRLYLSTVSTILAAASATRNPTSSRPLPPRISSTPTLSFKPSPSHSQSLPAAAVLYAVVHNHILLSSRFSSCAFRWTPAACFRPTRCHYSRKFLLRALGKKTDTFPELSHILSVSSVF